MNNVLVKDGARYSGKYVATRSLKDKSVVSSGRDPVVVYTQAKEKGVRNPVITYVPRKGVVHIY